jgi:hypothetical protein
LTIRAVGAIIVPIALFLLEDYMAEIIKYGSKRFLSEEDVYSTGSICTYSTVEVSGGTCGGTYHSSEVVIKDCNKTISLDMHIKEEGDLEERIQKIDIMVEELVKFKGALTEHWEILKKTRGEGDGS